MIYLYIGHIHYLLKNLYKNYATNGRNETCNIRKSHINKFEKTMRMITNMQIDIHT